MAGLQTTETNRSVDQFLENIASEKQRKDSAEILALISEVTGVEPKVWGNEKEPDFIIGFGKYSYSRKGYKQEFEWYRMGFAPRKGKLSIYLSFDEDKDKELLRQLGKCSWGKGCLYINKLEDIDVKILKILLEQSKARVWN